MPGAAATALLRTMIHIRRTRQCYSPRFLRCSCGAEPDGRASSSISPRTNRPKPEEPNPMVRAVLDHLVVAAATLEEGEDYVETRLGARPLRGGRHVAMGTHNSLLKLGEKTYLEVIAIDP